jgi:hypothetical protein
VATITTLRPSATSSGTGWSASATTLHGDTSDDSDATYDEWSGSGSAMILATPLDSPPAGEKRHLVRLRARGQDGLAWWAVRLASGSLVAGASGSFGASPETISGSWGSGAPATGSTVLSAYVSGQSSGVKINELYLDVDTREPPDFTPQIRDGSGAVTTTISDTTMPSIRADSIDTDDLNPRKYRYWVTLGGAIVWDTGEVSGAAIERQTTPLENGSYVAHLQVWSTLGSDTSYASDEETISFDMAVGVVPPPPSPSVTPDLPMYGVEVCAPDTTGFDDYEAWIEVQRVSCPHSGYLNLPGESGSVASSADASPSPFNDLEVTVCARRDDEWRPDGDHILAAKYLTTGDQRSWRLFLDEDGGGDPSKEGRPALQWSPDGTLGSIESAYASERMPIDPYGVVTLRAYLDVDNGAGGWTVTFETLDGDGNWVQLGNQITGSGTSSIHDGSADYTIGAYISGGSPLNRFEGRVYSVQIRDGQSGTIYADIDFAEVPSGTTEVTDSVSRVWDIEPPAAIISAQTATTIGILGPLGTDECDELVDYSLPRSGMGATCDHDPVECCSYYRARTVGLVDGSILVSAWAAGILESPSDPEEFCLTWSDSEHLIRTTSEDGPIWTPVWGKFSWTVDRPFTASIGVNGTRFVTSAPPGGRNLQMEAAVESEEELATLRTVLARPLVLISPSDASEVWAAPVGESVRVVKVGRIRQISASFIGTGPEPAPQLADVGG